MSSGERPDSGLQVSHPEARPQHVNVLPGVAAPARPE